MGEMETGEWTLIYEDWNPDQQPLREALCTLGNGCFCTRGAAEEASAGGPHYPGTYLGGGYNRLESEIAGRVIENEDLVNWPNWLCLTFRPEDGEWFHIDRADVQEFRQELDIARGVLYRRIRFRDHMDRETTICSRRIVHMDNPQLAAIQWTITPENWSGRIEIQSALDGSVTNTGVARYRDLNGRHLNVLETGGVAEDGIYLAVETNQSHIRVAQAARTQVFSGNSPATCQRRTHDDSNRIAQHLLVDCQRHKTLRIEKIVALCTSRDHALSEPALEAGKLIQRAPEFDRLLEAHELSWSHIWKRCDLDLQDDMQTKFILRFHVFHLLQTVSANTVDRDVGVPSRGWHGEAYRGHILWDELFIFPFLDLRLPELTRELLLYRYRRLNEARHLARTKGFQGAMYPWQSGSDGREESQVIHLNPQSGRWIPDDTYLQRHVNAAIAYNVWQYYQATGNLEFLTYYGAEMILEIARFWASIAQLNPERDRFEIRGVVGPDEFHTRYPGSDQPGLNNNAYTNFMAAWCLRCAGFALDALAEDRQRELLEDLDIHDEELKAWDDVGRRMFLPFHGEAIISQFEGYDELEEFDWEGYRQKYGDIQRLDRILDAENDTPNRYKASKQADVLMLFFLFSSEELAQMFEYMDYQWDPEIIPNNIRYYLDRTSHGSTLSRVVHAWVVARSDRERSWNLLKDALRSDVADIQGGTTSEGIHLGAMAGTVDLIQRCYTGIEMREDVLWLNPRLPEQLSCLKFRIRYRGHWLSLEFRDGEVTVQFDKGWAGPAQVGFCNEVYTMQQGDKRRFSLSEPCNE